LHLSARTKAMAITSEWLGVSWYLISRLKIPCHLFPFLMNALMLKKAVRTR
jgi:hypothetical protein